VNDAAYLAMLRAAKNHLGRVGAMLSQTKTSPEGEVVLWNARVFAPRTEVWSGDLNMTRAEMGLLALAVVLGTTVYVFPESAGILGSNARPRLTKAAYRVTDDGEIWLNDWHLERGPDGRLCEPGGSRIHRDRLIRQGRSGPHLGRRVEAR
jgi:hypothetical protein